MNQNAFRRGQRWHFWLLFAVLLLPLEKLHAQQDRVAALKQSLAENQKLLQKYQWMETTIVSLKGDEKSRIQKLCSYGPDGKVQKQQITAPPPQQPSGRRLKAKVVAKKKEELSDYMKKAVDLVHQYVPPSPERIQAAKDTGKVSVTPNGSDAMRLDFRDFVKPADSLSININLGNNTIQAVKVATYLESPKDSITLDARFTALNDGVNYVANAVLVAPAKKIQVVVQNSDYRRIVAATAPSKRAQQVQQAQQEAFEDRGWPRERSNQVGRRTNYEPQIDDPKELQARMAIFLIDNPQNTRIQVPYL
jgi:hypothetical protein